MPDEHYIWRMARNNLTAMRESVPEGYEPIVEAYLIGWGSPVRVENVQTDRHEGWSLILETDSEDDPHPSDRRVFVRPGHVAHVEIRYVRKSGRTRPGFHVGEIENDSVTD